MVYVMQIYTDGGCRGNGQPGARGAAAVIFKKRNRKWTTSRTLSLPLIPHPTNQRAEIWGIILALNEALRKLNLLRRNPRLDVTIHTDSRYAIGCMTEWINKWRRNGWTNAAGNEVVNRDLIETASALDLELKERGSVEYVWVPREKNWRADKLCNDDMDDQCRA